MALGSWNTVLICYMTNVVTKNTEICPKNQDVLKGTMKVERDSWSRRKSRNVSLK